MEEEIETATLAKGTLWTFAAQALTKLTSFIYLIIVARLFLPDDVGIFYFVLGIVSLIGVFADLGLMQSLPRYVPYLYGKREFGKLRNLIIFLFSAGSLLAAFFSIVLFLASGFLAAALGRPETKPVFEVFAVFILLSELTGLANGLLLGRKKIKETQTLSILQGIVKLAATVVLAFYLGPTALSLACAFLFAYIPLILVLSWLALKEINSWKKEPVPFSFSEYSALGNEVLAFGILVSLVAVFNVIATSTDRIMIGLLGGQNAFAEVGIYSIVTTFAGLLFLPLSSVITIFFPMVSELFGREKMDSIRKITAVAIKWSIIISMPLAILLLAFPDTLLRMFYGADYAAGATVLVLYLLGIIVFSLALLPLKVIAAMRRLDVELKISVVAAIANVILNFILIPLWGMNGAALATFVSFMLMTALAFHYSKKLFNFDFPAASLLPLFSALLAFLLLYFSRQYLLDLTAQIPLDRLTVLIGGMDAEIVQKILKLVVFGVLFIVACGLYFGFLVASRSFGKEELEIVHKAMRRLKIPEKYAHGILRLLGGQPS